MKPNYYGTPIRISHRTGPRYAIWIKRIIITVILIAAVLAGLLQIRSPRPAGTDAPPESFSSARAMEKVEMIAREPHPSGSSAHAQVRDYIIAELEHLGLHPEIQEANVAPGVSKRYSGKLENIVVRIPGTNSSKPLMLAAHYDSVATAPGAADDGSGVAAMLETARALQASSPLKNDLILLMTDGEEHGMLGAKAFVSEHPWAGDVGLVLNFEARGNKGPSFMFETSDQNGWIIREFTRAAPSPVAYSLIYNLYKLMPNDTDLTKFKEGGMPGLNFAFGVGLNAYHTELDTAANLDPSSLQHQGDYMLNLARHFGNQDLNQVQQQDRVYFNTIGWSMISYPKSWIPWFTGLAVLLFIATVWHGIYARRVQWMGLVGGLFVSLLTLVVIYGINTLLWGLLRSGISEDRYQQILMDPQVSVYYLAGSLLVTLLLAILIVRVGSRFIRSENIWLGAMTLWLLLCVGTSIYLPGGSYVFTWPLVFSLIGLNLLFFMEEEARGWLSTLFAVPGFVLLTPICYLIYYLLTLNMAGALMVIAALAFSLIFPLFCRPRKAHRDIFG
ncbi:M20/M25/M40 family metallo-hydrolase [Paenibacillus motobuensis]